ncbi:MAG: Ig-like domain-containing protein [Flavobacteriaceae bacterium]|nr:Ig-like domain-containing protein [Flavobacteriaceae bacterium]
MLRNLIFFFLLFIFLISSCAKRGTPTGGYKDTIPPVMVNASPKNRTTFFNSEKITITFDEYISLKDITQQLIISPPIESDKFNIEPQSTISKKIKIEFTDSLSLNDQTTYTFNFGSSIEDNNESNTLPFFSYTLSTGPVIDSLFIKGKVSDAFEEDSERFVSIYLYPIDSTHNDSTIYLKKPLYATSTLDSVLYNFQNLREDTYQIIAIKDYGKNYLYDQGVDKIGFINKEVSLPGDTLYNFKLFKEQPKFFWDRPKYVNDHHIVFGYYGTPEKNPIELITPVPEGFETFITKVREKDSLNFWFPEIEADSLQFAIKTKDSIYNVSVKFYSPELDSLVISPKQNRIIDLNDTLEFNSSLPITELNKEFITLKNKDSIILPFQLILDKNRDIIQMHFEHEPNDKYSVSVLPNAFKDPWGGTNDSINLNLITKAYDSYGVINLKLNWEIKEQDFILELLDINNNILSRVSEKNKLNTYTFEFLNPTDYKARIILDDNKNKKWDTGNYLKKIQPERVIYFSDTIELRANWEINEVFILK